jgi:multidrug efflux pump subunit AcrB
VNMSTWAIRNPVAPIALFLVLCLAGLYSFFALPITRFPNVDVPIVTIQVTQPGAAASELVNQVTVPIEDEVASVSGVDHVSSTTTEGLVKITVQFLLETDSNEALNDVKDAVDGVRGDLPDDITEPIVRKLDVTGDAIMTYAVADRTRTIEDLSWFVDEVIARDLQGAPGRSGMMPSALGIGEGGEFRSPMAIAVIGGLLVSTLLSLLFVPSLFGVIEGLRGRLGLGHPARPEATAPPATGHGTAPAA